MKKQSILKTVVGACLLIVGTLGIISLVFFYSTILFSDKWPALSSLNEAFRLMFTIPSGIVVIYSSFLVAFLPFVCALLYGIWFLFGKKLVSRTAGVLLLALWCVALIFGSVTTLSQARQILDRIGPFSQDPVLFDVESQIPQAVDYVFKTTLKNEVREKIGTPIEGYEPFMFLEVFPGLTETDFDNAEASIGEYAIEDGRIVHKLDTSKIIHSAAKAVTDRGLTTLLANVSVRLGVDLTDEGTLTEIMEALIGTTPPTEAQPIDMVACTMDAKLCPDGSAVGRQGPLCEFAPCP